ncbi:ketoacyl-ACP synthase III [Nicoliella spurrieriana]|uniref:Beta-ketoacyl-[acyl-carrier-protein] synthase III n=1 Tax=Nicoliella spurrieriana TaxID=2925830 RepID=A0A976RTL4_9LACO|nr:beta-ketoacyl-ACP synthase III [Nicoliella spurrieriana]UQS87424.1 ketoacyl-ACP synthase III [Nicoliella spurrieriana]
MSTFSIMATAKAVPDRVVTNDDLAQIMDTSDEWISRRTGIKRRHVVTDETNTSLATNVAKQLLAKTHVSPEAIDFIIVATMSGDQLMPSTAAAVQGQLKAGHALAFDISAACSGFSYGLDVMNALLATHPDSTGILIGSEALSKLIDWHDRTTAVLFGDGAGGLLVTNRSVDAQGQFLSGQLDTYGADGDSLTMGKIANRSPFTDGQAQSDLPLHMDGHRVFDFAIRRVPESIQNAVAQAGLKLSDVDFFILHQANQRIVKSVARKLKLPFDDRFPINIDEYGNTSAASEAILLAELVAAGKVKRGDILVMAGFGGGLTTGTVVIKY